MADTPASLPCPPKAAGRFSFGTEMGAGAPTSALTTRVPPSSQRAKAQNQQTGLVRSPEGNRDSSIALPTRHVLPRLHPVFILRPWLTVCVCHVRAGGVPPPVRAAQLRWAKTNTGAGLLVVTTAGRAFGDVSPVLDVPPIRLSPGRGPQDAASISQRVPGWSVP